MLELQTAACGGRDVPAASQGSVHETASLIQPEGFLQLERKDELPVSGCPPSARQVGSQPQSEPVLQLLPLPSVARLQPTSASDEPDTPQADPFTSTR